MGILGPLRQFHSHQMPSHFLHVASICLMVQDGCLSSRPHIQVPGRKKGGKKGRKGGSLAFVKFLLSASSLNLFYLDHIDQNLAT